MIKLSYGAAAIIFAIGWCCASGCFMLGAIWQSIHSKPKPKSPKRMMIKPGAQHPHEWCSECVGVCDEFVKEQ